MSTDDISQLKAELKALRLEKESLANQVKRLVQAEAKLYDYQEQLDAQLKEYQDLYELNRKLSLLNYDLPTLFRYASSYTINTLGYERVIFLKESERPGVYEVAAVDGYYDQQEREEVSALTISADDPLVAPVMHGEEYRICAPGCTDPPLARYRDKLRMEEYLLYLLGSTSFPLALIILGNSKDNAQFHRRVVDSSSLLGTGNLVGLLTSTMERQLLYASMENALEQERVAEAKYRSIFENALEGIYQSTPEGRFLSCNPAMAAILGYQSPQEVIDSVKEIGRQLYVDSQRYAELMAMVKEGREVKDFEAELFRKDGTRLWARLSVRPCFRDSRLLYLDGIMQDVTEHKRSEEALTKLSQAVEQSPVTILITDTKGVIEFVNPKFVQLTGYSREEVLGKTPALLGSAYNSREMYQKLWETVKWGGLW